MMITDVFATKKHSDNYENGGGVYGFYTYINILIRSFPNYKLSLINSSIDTYNDKE